jgi:hypothetical protein
MPTGMVRSCMGTTLKHVIQGMIEYNERQGRRRKQLLGGLKNRRIFWKLKEEA